MLEMTRRRDYLTANDTVFPKWSLGPKTGSVDGICQQTDSMNRFYLDVKTGSKRLWSDGYNISGSKLNLWINSCSFLVFIVMFYSSSR